MTTISITGSYDYSLVVLSISISIFASYAALDLVGRVSTAIGAAKSIWLTAGAVAMGTGIWAMHYVGMEAFHLPVLVEYNWPIVVYSLYAAIAASAIALWVVSRPTMSSSRVILGSTLMGSGIAAMHYIGMRAMRMPAMCVYSSGLVLLSIVLAIITSYGALRLAFAFKEQSGSWSIRKVVSTLIMGLGIPVTHYVGVAAVSFVRTDKIQGSLDHAVNVSILSVTGIALMTLLILACVIVSSTVDRRLTRQAQELAESRSQMQVVFDNMADGIVTLDLRGNIVQANPSAIKLLDLDVENLSSQKTKDAFEVYKPGGELLDRRVWPGAMALRDEFLHYAELEIKRKDTGKALNVEISTTPVRSREGKTVQIIVSYRDITDRKDNLNARARLAAIVDSSEDAIIGKDDKGIVRSWNAAAEKIFGYSAEEMIGESIIRLVPSDRKEEELGFLDRIEHGEVIDHIETTRKTKDGKLVYVSLTISPIRDANGKVVGASKIARDITERKQLEKQLHQSQKMEAIGQLTGGIAHDFNNLLGVVIGNLSLLERNLAGDEKALKQVRTSQKAAWRGADLIRRLLTFSSSEDLVPVTTSIDDSIRNLVELASRTLGPEITILTHLGEGLPPVFVDRSGLESALLNLAVNARDAMPKGGTLTITTELKSFDQSFPSVKVGDLKAGPYLSVSMADSGSGMSQEILARVFEPFFTTKPRGKGPGLGLAMVYGFAKQSHGIARIYSEVGYGTTVTLFLPLADGAPVPVKAERINHPMAAPGSTVLVVDDESDLLEIACAYLVDTGYETRQALNGASALAFISEHRDIDLVITDVIMPGGMNGVELVQKIREFLPHVKVIYSSGFSADALAERSGTIIDGLLLHKPYDRAEFDDVVRRAMGAAAVEVTG